MKPIIVTSNEANLAKESFKTKVFGTKKRVESWSSDSTQSLGKLSPRKGDKIDKISRIPVLQQSWTSVSTQSLDNLLIEHDVKVEKIDKISMIPVIILREQLPVSLEPLVLKFITIVHFYVTLFAGMSGFGLIVFRNLRKLIQGKERLPLSADLVISLNRFLFSRLSPVQFRYLFKYSYSVIPFVYCPNKSWITYSEVKGIKGRWIGKPKFDLEKPENRKVMLMIPGGGFVFDSGALGLPWAVKLVKEMNQTTRRFSIFAMQYKLAPEAVYPSQIIQALAAYNYLLNDLHIKPANICIAGESAGGCVATSLLLHLSRPSPSITAIQGKAVIPTYQTKPGALVLISPLIKLFSKNRQKNHSDVLGDGVTFAGTGLYIGVQHSARAEIFDLRFPDIHPLVPVELPSTHFLFKSPYVSPSVLTEPTSDPTIAEYNNLWLKEALPKTFIAVGENEILYNDIIEFSQGLERAGIETEVIEKKRGIHAWVLLDHILPNTAHRKEEKVDGVKLVAEFLSS